MISGIIYTCSNFEALKYIASLVILCLSGLCLSAQKTIVQSILLRRTPFKLKLTGLSFTLRTQNKTKKEKFFSRNRVMERVMETMKIVDKLCGLFLLHRKYIL